MNIYNDYICQNYGLTSKKSILTFELEFNFFEIVLLT